MHLLLIKLYFKLGDWTFDININFIKEAPSNVWHKNFVMYVIN